MNEKILNALGEELGKEVQAKLTEAKIELAIMNDGSVVPAEKYDKLKGEYKELENQTTTMDQKIKELSANDSTIDDLKSQLSELKGEYDAFKSESEVREVNFKKQSKLKELLSKNFNPDAVDLLLNTMDLKEINLTESGDIVDGQAKMDRLAESKPSLKLVQTVEGTPPKDKQTVQDVDYSQMSDEEYYNSIKGE